MCLPCDEWLHCSTFGRVIPRKWRLAAICLWHSLFTQLWKYLKQTVMTFSSSRNTSGESLAMWAVGVNKYLESSQPLYFPFPHPLFFCMFMQRNNIWVLSTALTQNMESWKSPIFLWGDSWAMCRWITWAIQAVCEQPPLELLLLLLFLVFYVPLLKGTLGIPVRGSLNQPYVNLHWTYANTTFWFDLRY